MDVWRVQRKQGLTTVTSVVALDSRNIRIRHMVRQFLTGPSVDSAVSYQTERSRRVRRYLGPLTMFVVTVALTAYTVLNGLTHGFTGASVMNGLGAVFSCAGFWSLYIRERTVPLSSLERISVDEANRKLTLELEAKSSYRQALAWIGSSGSRTETFRFPDTRTLREASETFRLYGVAVDNTG